MAPMPVVVRLPGELRSRRLPGRSTRLGPRCARSGAPRLSRPGVSARTPPPAPPATAGATNTRAARYSAVSPPARAATRPTGAVTKPSSRAGL